MDRNIFESGKKKLRIQKYPGYLWTGPEFAVIISILYPTGESANFVSYKVKTFFPVLLWQLASKIDPLFLGTLLTDLCTIILYLNM